VSPPATLLRVDDEPRATIGSGRRRELIGVGRAMTAAACIQRMTCRFDAHIIASEETFAEVIRQRAALYEILARHQAAPVSAPA